MVLSWDYLFESKTRVGNVVVAFGSFVVAFGSFVEAPAVATLVIMADAPAVAKRERGPSFEVSIDAEDDIVVSVHERKRETQTKRKMKRMTKRKSNRLHMRARKYSYYEEETDSEEDRLGLVAPDLGRSDDHKRSARSPSPARRPGAKVAGAVAEATSTKSRTSARVAEPRKDSAVADPRKEASKGSAVAEPPRFTHRLAPTIHRRPISVSCSRRSVSCSRRFAHRLAQTISRHPTRVSCSDG